MLRGLGRSKAPGQGLAGVGRGWGRVLNLLKAGEELANSLA